MMKLKKGFAVAMAAGVLTTGGLGVQASLFTAVANAQPEPQIQFDDFKTNLAAGADTAGVATIPDEVTLTIHKYDENASSDFVEIDNHGQEVDPAEASKFGAPLSATFTVQKITEINLKTNDGWKKAEALQADFKNSEGNAKAAKSITDAGYTLGTAVDMTTDESTGEAAEKFSNGFYLVTETSAPIGFQASVKPFVVALPMTNFHDRTKWLENVHVYPKNEEQETEEPTKTVKDGGVQAFLAGSKLEYAFSQKIVDGDKYNSFSLIDFYPEDRLETPADLTVKIMNVADPDNPTEVEVLDAADFSAVDVAADGRYTITLSDTGLEKVNAQIAVADLAVVATFKMTVKDNDSAQDATAPVMNKFKTILGRENQKPTPKDPNSNYDPNDPNQPPESPQDPNDPNNPFPRSYYGSVDIVKKDSDGTRMAGAEFELYTCDAQGVLSGNPLNWKDKDGNNTYDDGEVVPIVADNDAAADIKGLLVNDFRDGKEVVDYSNDFYCLKETKAPQGFELLAEPIPFQVLKKSGETGDDAAKVELTSIDVVNVKKNGGFDLPLTGGKGVFALLLAGAAFLVLGRGYSVYAGRRNKA